MNYTELVCSVPEAFENSPDNNSIVYDSNACLSEDQIKCEVIENYADSALSVFDEIHEETAFHSELHIKEENEERMLIGDVLSPQTNQKVLKDLLRNGHVKDFEGWTFEELKNACELLPQSALNLEVADEIESREVKVMSEKIDSVLQSCSQTTHDPDSAFERETLSPSRSLQEMEMDGQRRRRKRKKTKLLMCKYCSKTCKCESELTIHVRKHTGEKPHKCTYCASAFSQKGTLTDHIRSHTGERPYLCKICGASFSQDSSCNTHYRRHTRQQNAFSCQVCLSSFTRRFSLKVHSFSHLHGPWMCSKCLLKFSRREDLESHVCRGSVYFCPVCYEEFACESDFTNHAKGHRPTKDHRPTSDNRMCIPCPTCSKEFAHKSDLKKHERIHSEEKQFVCALCGSAFRQKENLAVHVRIHSDTKLYQCDLCSKTFKLKSYLSKHIVRQHSSCTPYI